MNILEQAKDEELIDDIVNYLMKEGTENVKD